MTLSENRSSLFFLCITLSFVSTHGARFLITNNCSFTVWAAAIPGGGRELNARGGTWTLNVSSGTKTGRLWARTGCNFDASGRGRCQTGDCGGLLQCQTYGEPPAILAEYSLNQFNNLDFYDLSLVDGFNVPMEFSPTSNGCTGLKCAGDINGQCPDMLKAPGGCYNPCTVFKTDQYCCTSTTSCGSDKIQNLQFVQIFDGLGVLCSTNYTIFFKDRCPDAFSYPLDQQSSTFTCPGGTDYKIVFCP